MVRRGIVAISFAMMLGGCFGPDLPTIEEATAQLEAIFSKVSPGHRFVFDGIDTLSCNDDFDPPTCKITARIRKDAEASAQVTTFWMTVDGSSGTFVEPLVPFTFELNHAIADYFSAGRGGASLSSNKVSVQVDDSSGAQIPPVKEEDGTINYFQYVNASAIGTSNTKTWITGRFTYNSGRWEFEPDPIKGLLENHGVWKRNSGSGSAFTEITLETWGREAEITVEPNEVIDPHFNGTTTVSYAFEPTNQKMGEEGRYVVQRKLKWCSGAAGCLLKDGGQEICTFQLLQPIALKIMDCSLRGIYFR